MPNKLKEGTLRCSYVESQVNNKAISLLAGLKDVTISSLIREAVNQYLDKEDPSGELKATADHLIRVQSDDADTRIDNVLQLATLERLKSIASRRRKS